MLRHEPAYPDTVQLMLSFQQKPESRGSNPEFRELPDPGAAGISIQGTRADAVR